MHTMTLLAQDSVMDAIFNLRNAVLLLLLIAIIVGYVMWRRRQM
jgi:hypothetical protein